ncbi:helicase, partial [Lactobacillus sp. LC28-10]
RLNGKGLHDVYDTMVEGPRIDWLIENYYLAPYRYYSVNLVDDTKLRKSSTGDFTNKSMDDAVGKTIFGDVVKTYQEKTPDQQAIVYAHSIEYSKEVALSFQKAGIKAAHADSKTPSAERDRIMSDFKTGRLQILCNVDLISEGFNVPDCSVVIMLRPTESLVLYIQQSMRSMRYQQGKTATIIDHVANYTRFGLPDDDRDWSLNDRKKKQRKNDATPIRTCEFCYAVIPASANICPVCGKERVIEQSENEIEEDNSVELERIHGKLDMKADYNSVRYARMKPADAQNMEDLQGIAKARHYKPGWVFYQAKNRGFIKTKVH